MLATALQRAAAKWVRHWSGIHEGAIVMRGKGRTRFIANLVRDSAGAAAAEYAVCLALLVGGVLAAGFLLGAPLKNSFSNAVAVGPGPPHAPSVRIAGDAASATAIRTVDSAPADGHSAGFWLAVAGAGLAPTSVTVWLVRRRAIRFALGHAADPTHVPKELQAKFVAKRQAMLKLFFADAQQLVTGHLTVRNIMSPSPMTKSPHDAVDELRMQMKESVIRHLLVCSPDGALVGIVSDRDLHARAGEHVGDIMTANPLTVTPESPVGAAITLMLAQRISCVPVVEEGQLRGIVTTSDLLMALQCVLRLVEQHALPAELSS
jgi:CBS domain-containing protein/Flp pilus assembly pilin Flp